MKTSVLLLALLAVTIPVSADEADQYYRQGMAAIQQGNPDAAKAAFQTALKLRPDHAQARYQLGQLPARAEGLKAQRRENEIGSIMLPAIDFEEVALSEALAALGQMIETESARTLGEDKALVPNFMVQDPGGDLGSKEVTLRLKNIPAKAAINYLLQQVSATARYDEHATVVRPAKK